MRDTITSAASIYVASLIIGGGAFLGFAVGHATGLAAVVYGAAAVVSIAGIVFAGMKTMQTMESEITR